MLATEFLGNAIGESDGVRIAGRQRRSPLRRRAREAVAELRRRRRAWYLLLVCRKLNPITKKLKTVFHSLWEHRPTIEKNKNHSLVSNKTLLKEHFHALPLKDICFIQIGPFSLCIYA